jgi:hypothetical protein
LALAYPEAQTIHLVMDNLNIHRRKSLSEVFGAEMATEVWDRFTVHYTPTHGSWLNQAEIEIGIFCRQCMGKRRIPDLRILRREARAWNRRMNRDRVKINWKFDRKTARRKFGDTKNSFTRSKTESGLDQLDVMFFLCARCCEEEKTCPTESLFPFSELPMLINLASQYNSLGLVQLQLPYVD